MAESRESWFVQQMRDQLRQLQERRQQLSLPVVTDRFAPSLFEMTRDHELAQVRVMIQRNMDSIDKQIKNSLTNLGNVLAEPSGRRLIRPKREGALPDVVLHSGKHLPKARSESRDRLLEAVKDRLQERAKSNLSEAMVNTKQSPRVALYEFCHEDKLSRLKIQTLPSVTLTADKLHVENTRDTDLQTIFDENQLTRPANDEEINQGSFTNRQDSIQHVAAIHPDDVAQAVADLLEEEFNHVFSSLNTQQSADIQPHRESVYRDPLLTVECSCQTENLYQSNDKRDSSMITQHPATRSVGMNTQKRMYHETETQWSMHSHEDSFNNLELEEKTINETDFSSEDEQATPPRSLIPRPLPEPLPDWNIWRQDCRLSPSPCDEEAEWNANYLPHKFQETQTAEPVLVTEDMSSSGTSSNVTKITTSLTSSSEVTISSLSEGQVPFRIDSPGQVDVSSKQPHTVMLDAMDGSHSPSEGEIFLSLDAKSPVFDAAVADGSTDLSPSVGEINIRSLPANLVFNETFPITSSKILCNLTESPSTGECHFEDLSTTDDVTVDLDVANPSSCS